MTPRGSSSDGRSSPPRRAGGLPWILALALVAALPACVSEQLLDEPAPVAACAGPEDCNGAICTADRICQTSGCGDRARTDDEECDEGAANGEPRVACERDCTARRCGDGDRDTDLGEACDDGNVVSGDACTFDCGRSVVCGDGLLDEPEACDDGNDSAGDGCRSDCLGVELCGDGLVNPGEGCDDGDELAGNGCDPDCGCGLGATAICVRSLLAAALRSDGAVFAWGRDPGVLLAGVTEPVRTDRPVRVPFGEEVVELACGESFLAARTARGSVLVLDGESLPVNFDGDPASPRPRELAGPFTALASGLDHLLLLDGARRVLAVGRNDHGQLGTGGLEAFAAEPVPVALSGPASAIAAGWGLSLAILEADGSVWGWGLENSWQFGEAGAPEERSPVRIGSLSGCDRLRAGGLFAFARCQGSWWAWGHDSHGAIAALTPDPPASCGSELCRPGPVPVTFPFELGELFPGHATSYATDTSGQLWGWGLWAGVLGALEWDLLGLGGEVADPTVDVLVPRALPLPPGVGIAAAGGTMVGLALLPDGSIHATGLDSNGVLGNGEAITHVANEWAAVTGLCD